MNEQMIEIAHALADRPVALLPSRAELEMRRLFGRAPGPKSARPLSIQAGLVQAAKTDRKIFDMAAGIAIIPVQGLLVQKLGCLHSYWGMTGYDGIRVKLLAAAQDPEVQGIAFDVDSYGGMVAGCFDLVDEIYAARKLKPLRAILTENACSAAYAIASAAHEISLPRTGIAGSIGVVCMHVDFSRALDEWGLKITLIHAGARKIDGNPYEPLPDAVRDRWQAEIDDVAAIFHAAVARNRGPNRGLDAKKIAAMEAATYRGEEAVAAGLADRVESPDQAVARFLAHLAPAAA